VGIVLGALLGVWGAWRGLVALAEWGVMQTPTDWDKELGAMAAKEIEGGAHVCTDSRLQAFADAMKDALVGEVKHDPFDFEFKVLREDAVNAFALPGGYVFINSGLLERAEDSSEVAGVLGHEINHALLRHGMKRIGRQLAVSLVVRVFLGGLGGLNTQAAGLAANLGELSFSRGEESEADAAGLPIVADAGFEPEGMIRFFKKLTEEESDVGEGAKTVMRYMSTHPLTEDRISDIRALIKKEHLAPNPDYADRVKTLDAELAAVSHTCDAAGDAGRDAADGDDERGRDRTPGGDGDEAESERAPDRGAEREGGR
jgi:predicted Zn-dependent protease